MQKFAFTAKISTKFAGDYFAFTRYTRVLYICIVMSVRNDPVFNLGFSIIVLQDANDLSDHISVVFL